MKKVMIAIDGGVLAEAVVEKGFELARSMGAITALVYVAEPSVAMSDSGLSAREWVGEEEVQGQHMLDRLKRQMGENDIWTFVEAGPAAKTILKLAAEWGADLLVIGTHGRKGVSRLLMGSVAENVIRHSDRPVLVVPSKRK